MSTTQDRFILSTAAIAPLVAAGPTYGNACCGIMNASSFPNVKIGNDFKSFDLNNSLGVKLNDELNIDGLQVGMDLYESQPCHNFYVISSCGRSVTNYILYSL